MKTVIKISFIVMLLFVAVAGAAAQSVYLAEAKRNPFERIVFIDDVGEKFRYTAFYDGASQPQEDIEVSFHVDAAMAASYNREHGTAYRMLPRGSYEMETGSAEITRGSVSAPAGEILVKGRGHLKAFEKYILPVTVRVEGGKRNTSRSRFLHRVLYRFGSPRSRRGCLQTGRSATLGHKIGILLGRQGIDRLGRRGTAVELRLYSRGSGKSRRYGGSGES